MVNELILVDKIEKRLREKREPPVFPLTPTHRKELRDLRNKNIGDLRDRLRNIKKIKEEEFVGKHKSLILKKFDSKKKGIKILNNDWDIRFKKIVKLLQERKDLEKTYDLDGFELSKDYSDIADLNIGKGCKREFTFDVDDYIKKIGKEKFEEVYGDKFCMVSEKIDDVHTKYEEAINFGDLEIVKELYYVMKKADLFFERVSKLKV